MTQAIFHDIIRHSYGPLVKALPLTCANESYVLKAPTMVDAPNPIRRSFEDVKGVDYVDVSATASRQPVREGGPPLRDGANGSPLKRVSPAPSPSLLDEPVYAEGKVDFRRPAAVRKQRKIWLPKDDFGLVEEIERDLDSYDILYSTACAMIDESGRVHVSLEGVTQNVLSVDVPTE